MKVWDAKSGNGVAHVEWSHRCSHLRGIQPGRETPGVWQLRQVGQGVGRRDWCELMAFILDDTLQKRVIDGFTVWLFAGWC